MIKHIQAFIKNTRNTLAHRKEVRNTFTVLSNLSNHELNDIGISRGEIYDIAHSSHTKPAKIKVEDAVQVNENLRGFV